MFFSSIHCLLLYFLFFSPCTTHREFALVFLNIGVVTAWLVRSISGTKGGVSLCTISLLPLFLWHGLVPSCWRQLDLDPPPEWILTYLTYPHTRRWRGDGVCCKRVVCRGIHTRCFFYDKRCCGGVTFSARPKGIHGASIRGIHFAG